MVALRSASMHSENARESVSFRAVSRSGVRSMLRKNRLNFIIVLLFGCAQFDSKELYATVDPDGYDIFRQS